MRYFFLTDIASASAALVNERARDRDRVALEDVTQLTDPAIHGEDHVGIYCRSAQPTATATSAAWAKSRSMRRHGKFWVCTP